MFVLVTKSWSSWALKYWWAEQTLFGTWKQNNCTTTTTIRERRKETNFNPGKTHYSEKKRRHRFKWKRVQVLTILHTRTYHIFNEMGNIKHIFRHIKIKLSFPHNLIPYYSFATFGTIVQDAKNPIQVWMPKWSCHKTLYPPTKSINLILFHQLCALPLFEQCLYQRPGMHNTMNIVPVQWTLYIYSYSGRKLQVFMKL